MEILDNEELSVLNLISEHNALTYNELIKLEGIYYSLYQTQFAGNEI